MNDERPPRLVLDQPTPCCGARLLVQCDGTYRCPCGKRQEELAKKTMREQLLVAPGIAYAVGDATQPVGVGKKIIPHVCNDIGAWGKGFVLAISKRWPEPEQRYIAWHAGNGGVNCKNFLLGNVQFVPVTSEITVANMIAQKGISSFRDVPPIRYGAVQNCLVQVAIEAQRLNASIHMPRIGCGLAGGKWDAVSRIVECQLIFKGIPVWVYDLPCPR